MNHGLMIRTTNNSRGNFYGTHPNVKISIRHVIDEQNFLVQERFTYLITFGQFFITASIMDTKIMDNGLAYTRIRSHDGKKTIYSFFN